MTLGPGNSLSFCSPRSCVGSRPYLLLRFYNLTCVKLRPRTPTLAGLERPYEPRRLDGVLY